MRERIHEYDGIAAGTIALVRIGGQVRVVTAGLADVAEQERMRRRHRFQIASVTKTMVATAVLQLVESGRLRLGDPVETWLPGLLPQGRRITVEHLLSHRSGLFDYLDSPEARLGDSMTPEQLITLSVDEGMDFAPGSDTDYSNTNFIVLGLVVERVTGQVVDRVLQERIFDPLGMTSTSLLQARVTEPPVVHGYQDGKDVTLTDLSVAWSAGGVVSTVDDLNRFFRALFAGELMSPDKFERMTTPTGQAFPGVRYGLGTMLIDIGCGTALGHGGDIDGFSTGAFTLEGGDRAVVVMMNEGQAGEVLSSVIQTALCD